MGGGDLRRRLGRRNKQDAGRFGLHWIRSPVRLTAADPSVRLRAVDARRSMRRHEILILVAFLAPIGVISEGASQGEGSPYTRLILYNERPVRQNVLMQFTNAKDACNFLARQQRHVILRTSISPDGAGSSTATLEFNPVPDGNRRERISMAARSCRAIDSGAIGDRARRRYDIKGPAQWGDTNGLFRNTGGLHKPCRTDHIRAVCVGGRVSVECFAGYSGDNHRDHCSNVNDH